MKKLYILIAITSLILLLGGLIAVYLNGQNSNNSPFSSPTPTPAPTQTSQPTPAITSSPTPTPTSPTAPTTYTYSIVNTYPHQINAFTEGLVYDNGVFYESTGGYGSSSLRRANIESGVVFQQVDLSAQYFGEGLTVVGDSLVQLTWREQVGFVYDKATLALKGNFTYAGEGWGLTYDGSRLIMSNGSSYLTFLDPANYQKTGELNVQDGNTPLTNLNELEYIKGDIYANIWLQQKIAIINAQTGQVKGYIDLAGIYQPHGSDDVLNGIAYDSQTNRLFVTGKNWPNLYQITVTPKN